MTFTRCPRESVWVKTRTQVCGTQAGFCDEVHSGADCYLSCGPLYLFML